MAAPSVPLYYAPILEVDSGSPEPDQTAPLLLGAVLADGIGSGNNGANISSSTPGVRQGWRNPLITRWAGSPPHDISGFSHLVSGIVAANYGMNRHVGSIADGGISFFIIDTSGRFLGWTIFASEYQPETANYSYNWGQANLRAGSGASWMMVEIAAPDFQSTEAIDLTQVSHMETHVAVSSVPIYLRSQYLFAVNRRTLIGGEEGNKASFKFLTPDVTINPGQITPYTAEFGLRSHYPGNTKFWSEHAPSLNGGLFVSRVAVDELSIGDGLTETHFESENEQICIAGSGPAVLHRRNVLGLDLTNAASYFGSTPRKHQINQSASDTCVMRDVIFSGEEVPGGDFDFEILGDPAASCQMLRVTFVNAATVSLGHGSLVESAFSDCDRVEVSSSVTLEDCRLRNSTGDGLAIIGGAGVYSGLDVTFSDNQTHDVTLGSGGAGTYDLSGLRGASGYTLKIHNESATDAVAVQLAEGVTYSTTTAGGAITVTTPPVTYDLVFPNIDDGSRYRIFNVTQDAEIANALVSGGTGIAETMVLGVDYDAGDEIRVRITAIDRVDEEVLLQPGASNATFSTPLAQTFDAIYALGGVDGSTVTKFTPDYVDLEIDIAVSANFELPELYAWYKHNLTSENGIRYFFGAVVAVDAANFMVDVTKADMRLDNLTATEVIQTDNRRLYRSDGQRPAKTPTTGGGGIDVNYQPTVLIAETGVSGLTPSESAAVLQIAQVLAKVNPLPADPVGVSDLAGFATAAAVAAVKAKTDQLPADPAGVSDLPVAPDNDAIAAIKARTDRLPDDPASSADVEEAAFL